MNLYYYLAYKIYFWYVKKGEEYPHVYTIMLVNLMIGINLFSLYSYMILLFPFTHIFKGMLLTNFQVKIIMASYIFIGAGIHYLILFKGNKQEEVFEDMEKKDKHIKNGGYKVVGYLIISILTGFLAVVLL